MKTKARSLFDGQYSLCFVLLVMSELGFKVKMDSLSLMLFQDYYLLWRSWEEDVYKRDAMGTLCLRKIGPNRNVFARHTFSKRTFMVSCGTLH